MCRDRRKPEVPPKACHFSATVAPRADSSSDMQPTTHWDSTYNYGPGPFLFALSERSFDPSPLSTGLPDHSLLPSLVDELWYFFRKVYRQPLRYLFSRCGGIFVMMDLLEVFSLMGCFQYKLPMVWKHVGSCITSSGWRTQPRSKGQPAPLFSPGQCDWLP